MLAFHQFIRRVRDVVGLTQKDVAASLELDRSTYSYYESGKTEPSIAGLKTLARIYNLTVDDLVYCRYRPIDQNVKREEPPERPLTDLACLRDLNHDETALVLLYRKAWDKDGLMRVVREFEDHMPDYDSGI